jgi:predicted amidophosphoribosyltransferase
VADRYCSNCGQELRAGGSFCPGCGRPVHETAHVPTPEADVPVPPPRQAFLDEGAPPPRRTFWDGRATIGA